MELLYSFMNGGSERLGAWIASDLVNSGWPVSVCATHTTDGPIRDWLAGQGVDAVGMRADDLSRIGRRWNLYRLIRSRRIEVLHVQHFSILALCYWPARLAGVRRIVVTEHNEKRIYTDSRMVRRSKYYGARADMVTVIHEGIRRYLVDELGLPGNRVRTILNGVDTCRFAPASRAPSIRRELGADPGEILVGSVARLHPAKDQGTLLRAFGRVCHTLNEPVKLVLVGDGEERERLYRLSSDLGVSERVHFTGDRTDIERVMPQLDVFVLSSQTEGVPLVLLEAMACGVPCISTDVGGIAELVDAGGGRIVPPKDTEALAAEIAGFVQAPDLRGEVGARARDATVSKFQLSNTLAAYREILRDSSDGQSGVDSRVVVSGN